MIRRSLEMLLHHRRDRWMDAYMVGVGGIVLAAQRWPAKDIQAFEAVLESTLSVSKCTNEETELKCVFAYHASPS